jgi:hypothetical protein
VKTSMARVLAFSIVLAAVAVAKVQAQAPSSKSSLPSCTERLSSLAVPDGPHGLFAILFPNVVMQAKAEQYLLHNPVVCGANMYLIWNDIDRGDGRYDFSKVEEEMAPWIKAGKQVNLISWATSYGGKRRLTPDYVFQQVQTVSCENAGEVPVFWEKGFVENYQKFMAAIVQHFGNNPSVGYIRFGLGQGGETFPACMYALKSKGFTPERWRKYLFDMLDYEGSLNSPKQLMVGINKLAGPPDYELPDAVARRAVQNKIAIGSQGFSVNDISANQSGSPCAVDWCHVFRDAAGKVPLELQTVKQTNPDGAGPVGSMVELLPFAEKLHAQIFEIYVQDWLVAYDPSDPDYAQHHQAYQQAFEAAAKVVGGH